MTRLMYSLSLAAAITLSFAATPAAAQNRGRHRVAKPAVHQFKNHQSQRVFDGSKVTEGKLRARLSKINQRSRSAKANTSPLGRATKSLQRNISKRLLRTGFGRSLATSWQSRFRVGKATPGKLQQLQLIRRGLKLGPRVRKLLIAGQADRATGLALELNLIEHHLYSMERGVKPMFALPN